MLDVIHHHGLAIMDYSIHFKCANVCTGIQAHHFSVHFHHMQIFLVFLYNGINGILHNLNKLVSFEFEHFSTLKLGLMYIMCSHGVRNEKKAKHRNRKLKKEKVF